jgi:hypothetical protein
MPFSDWPRTLTPDDIQALGTSLRPVTQHLKPGRVWYYGDEPYFDIFFDLQDGDVHWFQFTLRGRSLTWQRSSNIMHTGNTNELAMTPALSPPSSKLIHDDLGMDHGFYRLVTAILTSRADYPLFQTMVHLLAHSRWA